MNLFRSCLLAFFGFLSFQNLHAQNTQISFSGNYGLLIDEYSTEKFKAYGIDAGLEFKFKKHWSFGGDLDWQFLEPEAALAEALTSPGAPPLAYSIIRHQFNIRPTARYYFKNSFQGLYAGLFGSYSYLTIKTSGYPSDPNYFPDLYKDPSDDLYMGLGLTYGYRLKLGPRLQASAYGSNQWLWNSLFADRKQQDHQFGLGLSWIF